MSASKTATKSGGKATTSTGCGCGCGCGGKTPSGGSKGCTCNDRPPPCPASGMLRPNFFAGQLLTEDDLQQIIIYQNGKRRLTNRFLFGTGVVCGFEVAAGGQSAPGTVIVQPGYALDCCGNDIVLSCPYTIDINEMVRDQGLDCCDPCGDSDGAHKYLLCVQYTECLSEPVSPYSPGSSQAACVNTRVQESCKFELRCPPKKTKPVVDLRSKLKDEFDKDDHIGSSFDWDQWGVLKTHAVDLLPPKPVVTLTPADGKVLFTAPATIKSVTSSFTEGSPREGWTEEKLNTVVEGLRVPARTAARLLFHPESDRTAAATPDLLDEKAINDQLKIVSQKLTEAAHWLRRVALPSFSTAPRVRALLLADEILRWTDSDSTKLDGLRKRNDVRLFISDATPEAFPYSWIRYQNVSSELAPGLGWQGPTTGDDFTIDTLNQLDKQAQAARHYSDIDRRRDICLAINPPCTPCDDLCVLLATVEVKSCKVMKICTLDRTIIISPAALGYWMPLREILPALCCDHEVHPDADNLIKGVIGPYLEASAAFFRSDPGKNQESTSGEPKS